MKTIVVVCVLSRDAGPSAEEVVLEVCRDPFQLSVRPRNQETETRIGLLPDAQSGPPFWTWFMENPRRVRASESF